MCIYIHVCIYMYKYIYIYIYTHTRYMLIINWSCYRYRDPGRRHDGAGKLGRPAAQIRVRGHTHTHTHIHIHIHIHTYDMYACVYVCAYVSVCVCMDPEVISQIRVGGHTERPQSAEVRFNKCNEFELL